jgi:hypothetical protein
MDLGLPVLEPDGAIPNSRRHGDRLEAEKPVETHAVVELWRPDFMRYVLDHCCRFPQNAGIDILP